MANKPSQNLNIMIKIKDILVIFLLTLCYVVSFFGTNSITAKELPRKTIHILHTNDTHGYIYPDQFNKDMLGIDKIAAIKAATHNAILVDAGDTLHGLPIANYSQGKDIIELMQAAGYNVMVPGNHDFNYGSRQLKNLSENSSSLKIISSNIYEKKSGRPYLDDTYVQNIDGIKVGFFGLTTMDTINNINSDFISGIYMQDYLSSATASIAKLHKEKADILIGVFHLARNEIKQIIPYIKDDVSVIIDGHEHFNTKEYCQGVLLAGAGEYGDSLGKITINISGKRIDSISTQLIQKDSCKKIPVEKNVEQKAKNIMANVDATMNQIIGYAEPSLSSKKGELTNSRVVNGVRNSETALGNFVADALRTQLRTDLALINGGSLRSDISSGMISRGSINSLSPFGNYVVIKEVTPKVIKQLLENGVESAPKPSGKFPQVSGIYFEYDTKAEKGNKIKRIVINNEVIDFEDDEKKYTLATESYLANGGDGYTQLREANLLYIGKLTSEIIEAYIDSLPNCTITESQASIEGRITQIQHD